MMLRSKILIERPADEVYTFISDYQNDWKWRTWYPEVQTLHGENKGECVLLRAPHPLFSSKKPGQYRILSSIPSHRLVSRIDLEKITLIDERQLKSQYKNSTKFEYTLHIRLNGLTRLLRPIFFTELQLDFQENLKWLKELLETLHQEKSQNAEVPEAF